MNKNIINALLLCLIINQIGFAGNRRLKEWKTPKDQQPTNSSQEKEESPKKPLGENEVPQTQSSRDPNDNSPLKPWEIPLDEQPTNNKNDSNTIYHIPRSIIDWVKDKFGFGKEENPERYLQFVVVKNPLDPSNPKGEGTNVEAVMQRGKEKIPRIDYNLSARKVPLHYTVPKHYNEGESYWTGQKWEHYFRKFPEHTMKRLLEIANKVTENEADYKKIANKYHKKGYNQRVSQEENINKQKFRKEGAQNALYGIGVIAATSYGIYRLINWLRGDLHALKKNIQHAQQAIAKSVAIIEKKDFKSQSDQILYTDIYNSKTTLNRILESIRAEEIRRKTAKK